MKKIVRGNDFTLRIPVKKIVNGEQVSFPLTDCTDIAVHVVSKYKRTALPYTIDKESNDVLLADVDGTTLSLGTYALEVTGVSEGANWRSYEYEQFAIVDNNASSDTVFEDNTTDGDTNIEDGNGDNANKGCMDVKIEGFAVDTALVVLPPVSSRATIIELIANADAAIAAVRETEAAVKASEDVRVESETLRQNAEEQRVESEATRQTAETQRTESEMERVANEEARKANESKQKLHAVARRAYARNRKPSVYDRKQREKLRRKLVRTQRWSEKRLMPSVKNVYPKQYPTRLLPQKPPQTQQPWQWRQPRRV